MTSTPSAPAADGLAEAYFSWHERDELRLQRCSGCGRWRHPPLVTCPDCGSTELTWERASGRGIVFSWTVTHYPLVPAFSDLLPYVDAVVECEEGPRVFALLVGVAPEAVSMGLAVTVAFADVGGRRVAVFRPSA
jgi:uncharacterized protein